MRQVFPGIFICLMVLIISAPVFAQDSLKNIPDPDPQKELEMMHIAEGFEVNLFAADPMVVKPIQMNWDAEGRLWVVSSSIYPQPKPGEEPHDKIYVLEDTTGDGTADRSTVFADGLLTPTGILPGDGGVYVANATEILHLRDTDGDGKADQKRKVLSGFGTGDTHHLIHTFRWGPAGMFYFNQSIYIYSHIETPWGIKRLEGGGVWQLRPGERKLDVYARGLVNPWGLRFGRWGSSFLTDGAGREGINYAFPGATFISAPGAERILQGLNPGQPKHSGLEVVSGRHLPESWQGNLISNDFRANRINRFVLEEQGSGYVSEQTEDLLWSNDVAFRPVDVSIGPDGAIYILDWYNPIIQHGEVDFRDPRRDHQHGRIWRIAAKDRPNVKPPKLVGASTGELLDALKLPEKWTREQAKRLLKERGADEVTPVLQQWVRNLDPADSEYEHHLLEALWVYQSLDAINKSLLRDLLDAKSHNARAAAARVLYYWYDSIDNTPGLLKEAVADDHSRVRLEAVIALRRQQNAEAASTALSVLDHSMDKFLDFALWQTIRELEPFWMPRLEKDPGYFGDPGKTAYALKSVSNPDAVKHLVQLYQRGEVPKKYHDDVFSSVASNGGIAELNTILELAMSDIAPHKNRRAAYLGVLEEAARQREKKPDQGLDRIGRFIHSDDKKIAAIAVRLIGYWDLKTFRERLGTLAQKGNDDMKKAALDALASMGDKESRKLLIEMTGADYAPELRLMATTQLVSLDVNKAASIAVKVLQEVPEETDASELFSAFYSQEGGIKALANKLTDQKIPEDIARAGRKAMQQEIPFNRKGDKVVQTLEEAFEASGGKLPPERMPQQLSSQQLNRLELDIKAGANPVHGEKLFRGLSCMSCHAIGGAGGVIGPDLSSLGANAPTDYIISSIIDPSVDIKDGFELNRVVKKDGNVVMGYPTRETASEVVLRNVGGEEISIPVSQIDAHENVPGSLMPPGLTSGLDREEFIDLVGFLSKLGEPGEYRVPNTRLVRRWQTLTDDEKVIEQIRENGLDYTVRGDADMPWQSAYSKVSGDLPLAELPVIELDADHRYSFVQFEVDVLSAGNVALSFNSTEGISVWAGQKPVDLTDDGMVISLSEGIHQFTLAINRTVREKGALRIELEDAEKASAQTKLIMGE